MSFGVPVHSLPISEGPQASSQHPTDQHMKMIMEMKRTDEILWYRQQQRLGQVGQQFPNETPSRDLMMAMDSFENDVLDIDFGDDDIILEDLDTTGFSMDVLDSVDPFAAVGTVPMTNVDCTDVLPTEYGTVQIPESNEKTSAFEIKNSRTETGAEKEPSFPLKHGKDEAGTDTTETALSSSIVSAVDHNLIRPSTKDVLLGRGKPLQRYPGYLFLRSLVVSHLDVYEGASKHKKTSLAESIVTQIKSHGGRFLKQKTTAAVSRKNVNRIMGKEKTDGGRSGGGSGSSKDDNATSYEVAAATTILRKLMR